MLRLCATALLVMVTVPAGAAGPVDGEATLLWWNNQFEVDADELESDVGSLGGQAEVWWRDRWGLRGSLYRYDLEDIGVENSDHFSVDLKRRFFSATDNNFLAVGLGWENIDLENGESSGGPRLLLEGRVGLAGTVYLYGQTAWLPELDDVGNRSSVAGAELEAGVSFEPAPFFSLRAGYRQFRLDFSDDSGDRSATTSGIVFGAGFHW